MIEFIKKVFKIKDKEEQVEVLAGGGEQYFIDRLGSKECENIIRSGKEFLEATEQIRFARRMALADEVLDHQDEEFNEMDARSLYYMMDKMFNETYRVIELAEERRNSLK